MRHQPLYRGFWQLLSLWAARLKKAAGRPRAARPQGLSGLQVRLPYWLLALRYCHSMRGKLAHLEGVAQRIRAWLASVRELSARSETSDELIDVRQAMRDDLECTKRALRELRDVCLDVSRLFGEAGYKSRRLARLQDRLVALLSESYELAAQLQAVLAEHDRVALARLRGMAAGTVE